MNPKVYCASRCTQTHSVVLCIETAIVCTSEAKEVQVETEMHDRDKIYSTDLAQPQDWCLHSGTHLYGF